MDSEMEWGTTTADELRSAKAKRAGKDKNSQSGKGFGGGKGFLKMDELEEK